MDSYIMLPVVQVRNVKYFLRFQDPEGARSTGSSQPGLTALTLDFRLSSDWL